MRLWYDDEDAVKFHEIADGEVRRFGERVSYSRHHQWLRMQVRLYNSQAKAILAGVEMSCDSE